MEHHRTPHRYIVSTASYRSPSIVQGSLGSALACYLLAWCISARGVHEAWAKRGAHKLILHWGYSSNRAYVGRWPVLFDFFLLLMPCLCNCVSVILFVLLYTFSMPVRLPALRNPHASPPRRGGNMPRRSSTLHSSTFVSWQGPSPAFEFWRFSFHFARVTAAKCFCQMDQEGVGRVGRGSHWHRSVYWTANGLLDWVSGGVGRGKGSGRRSSRSARYEAQRVASLLFHIWCGVRQLSCRCCLDVRSPPHRPCPSHTRVFGSPPLRMDESHFTKNLPLTCSDGRHAGCIPRTSYSMHELVSLHIILVPQFFGPHCSCLSLRGTTAGALACGWRLPVDQIVNCRFCLCFSSSVKTAYAWGFRGRQPVYCLGQRWLLVSEFVRGDCLFLTSQATTAGAWVYTGRPHVL